MKKLIIGLLLIGQVSLACNKPVTYLTKGTPAVCDGYLFSPEQEKLVREYKMQFEGIKGISEQQGELIQILDQRVDVLARRNDGLNKQVQSLESQKRFEQIVYFALGLVVGVSATRMVTK